MKTLIIANSCPWKSWDTKIKELKAWWLPEINLDITLEHTNFKDIIWEDHINAEGKIYKGISQKWYDDNISLPAVKRGFDCVIFVVSNKDWKGGLVQGWNAHNNLGIHEITTVGNERAKYNFLGTKYDGDQWFNIARHELSHAIYRSRGGVDNTHAYWQAGNLEQVKKELTGGFIENTFVRYFKNLITPVKMFRYFNQNEVEGLDKDFVLLLDEARHKAGVPFVLNSTLRSAEKNAVVGGVKDSAHTKGLAVDIACTNSANRSKIVKALMEVGISRIGIASTFIHGDVDKSKVQNVIWLY